MHNGRYLKTKTKSYEGKVNTKFHGDKVPKEGSQYIFLSVILIDSVFRTGKNYFPQVFLEECEYIVKEKKMPQYITENVESCSDEENSDEEKYSQKNSDEESYI